MRVAPLAQAQHLRRVRLLVEELGRQEHVRDFANRIARDALRAVICSCCGVSTVRWPFCRAAGPVVEGNAKRKSDSPPMTTRLA
eukprot:3363272-Pleurochrysis_carterae.AAC.1